MEPVKNHVLSLRHFIQVFHFHDKCSLHLYEGGQQRGGQAEKIESASSAGAQSSAASEYQISLVPAGKAVKHYHYHFFVKYIRPFQS